MSEHDEIAAWWAEPRLSTPGLGDDRHAGCPAGPEHALHAAPDDLRVSPGKNRLSDCCLHAKAPPRALRKAQGACEEPRSLQPPSATAAGTRLGPNFCSACTGTSLLPDLTRGGLHLTLRITDERTITWTLSLTDLARDGGGSTGKPRFESRPFAMPPACLPAACQHLLAHHRWCLVWQAAGAGGDAVSGRTRRRTSASLSLSLKV
jgi:hypothetical protein